MRPGMTSTVRDGNDRLRSDELCSGRQKNDDQIMFWPFSLLPFSVQLGLSQVFK